MSRPKERIAVNGPQIGLNAAFMNLQIEGLPEGDVPVSPPETRELSSVKPGRVILRRETAHRGGKVVLVIDGFGPQHSESMIESWAKRLRNSCGCGGTVRDRIIEIQGNHVDRVRGFLESHGFQVAGER